MLLSSDCLRIGDPQCSLVNRLSRMKTVLLFVLLLLFDTFGKFEYRFFVFPHS